MAGSGHHLVEAELADHPLTGQSVARGGNCRSRVDVSRSLRHLIPHMHTRITALCPGLPG